MGLIANSIFSYRGEPKKWHDLAAMVILSDKMGHIILFFVIVTTVPKNVTVTFRSGTLEASN